MVVMASHSGRYLEVRGSITCRAFRFRTTSRSSFVMELTAGPSFEDQPVYQVRVLSTRNASVLAVFTSTGRRDNDEDPPYQWVATDRGYEKRVQPVSLAETGRELALQTMARMAP